MSTPVVTEIPQRPQAVVRDTFIDGLSPAAAPRPAGR
jgi:hypothetical protein